MDKRITEGVINILKNRKCNESGIFEATEEFAIDLISFLEMQQTEAEYLEKKLLCMIEYVERDCACMIPIDRFFNADGTHITKKKYGLVLLEILGQELRDKFLETQEVKR